MYKVTTKTIDINRSTVIDPSDFSGWMCRNTGENMVYVDGYPLAKKGSLNYTDLNPDVIWGSPISVEIPTTGTVRFTFLRYAQK